MDFRRAERKKRLRRTGKRIYRTRLKCSVLGKTTFISMCCSSLHMTNGFNWIHFYDFNTRNERDSMTFKKNEAKNHDQTNKHSTIFGLRAIKDAIRNI